MNEFLESLFTFLFTIAILIALFYFGIYLFNNGIHEIAEFIWNGKQ